MNLKIDAYYKNKKTGSFHLFHEDISDDDIAEIIKARTEDSKPMWMNEDWEYYSFNVDKIDL